LVSAFERLPGVGPKSATRLAFYLLNTPRVFTDELGNLIMGVKERVRVCSECFNLGEGEICHICANEKRKQNLICVVERVVDLLAIENVGGFAGVYHVLGGAINPLDHIGPEDLKIAELIKRVVRIKNNIQKTENKQITEDNTQDIDGKIEIILATNPTMEGEATALYIKNQIMKLDQSEKIKISRIGSGLPMGSDLEYADQATVARAMEGRREV